MGSILEKERIEGRIEGKIELARDLGMKDEDIVKLLMIKLNMSEEEAKGWIGRYDRGERL